MTLSELSVGESARISQVQSDEHGESLVSRLAAMGLVADKEVCLLRKAAFGGPLHVRVGLTTELAIRRCEAANVWLHPLGN
jgi:ferrous iron transport protein A